MHTIVVHAGILPSDPRRSANDVNQPLIEASHSTSSPNYDASLARNSEEVSILLDVPQNTKPWNLLNMRGVYFKGKHQGEVSKSSKKGKPWSEVWKKEMKRCKGPGAWFADGMGEWGAEHDEHEDEGTEGQEDGEGDELVGQERRDDEDDMESDLKCSPVTVIYGHAGELKSKCLCPELKKFSWERSRCQAFQQGDRHWLRGGCCFPRKITDVS
jgi:hypothetical protein